MRVGLIARADSTGLGIQSKEFFDHIPCRALVIDFSAMSPGRSLEEILRPNLHWYPSQQVFKFQPPHDLSGRIPREVIEEFIEGLDIVFAMETPYDYNIFRICRERGIKTILQPNYEFLDYPSRLPDPDLFAVPSLWNWDQFPVPKVHLPVPANTAIYPNQVIGGGLNYFVHVVGRAAMHDRNGTQTFLNALQYVKNDIVVRIKSQQPLRFGYALKSNIEIQFDCENKNHYSENYSGGTLVMPRKYGGLCLPIQEALAAWMPVIATDVHPNNLWLPKKWLVESEYKGQFRAKKMVDMWEASPEKLAQKIDKFCDPDFYKYAQIRAGELRESISWKSLYPLYRQTFQTLLQG